MGRIREALRRPLVLPRRLFRAYLAEEYDGIGQYVLVTLARSSTVAAIKARVAAGDFGGGRKFPAGTPVVIHSNRGLLEILSLGNLAGCVFETFDSRTETDGWGLSTNQFLWDSSTPTLLSVSDGIGVIEFDSSSGGANVATLWSKIDENLISLLIKVKFSFVGSGSNLWSLEIDLPFSSVSCELGVGNGVSPNSGFIILTGAVTSDEVEKNDWLEDSWYFLKLEYHKLASICRLKFWLAEQSEPATWLLSRDPINDLFFSGNSQISISTVAPANGELVSLAFDYIHIEPCK